MYFNSITKKQIVAVTGLGLILFIIVHLSGNFWIYAGPDAFNAYSKELRNLGALLWIARVVLLTMFVTHFYFTYLLVMENIKARGGLSRYAVDKPVGNRSWATRLMPYTGTYILLFVLWHLIDFTFIDHEGARSMIHGISYGLYGVVVNSFFNPIHSWLYVLAMCFLGFHLMHGIESLVQTLGFNHPKYTPLIKKSGTLISILIVIGFSSIPLYILYVLPR